jgi:hypothetical protein
MKHVLMAAIAATRLLTGSAAKAVTLKVEYDLARIMHRPDGCCVALGAIA